MKRAIKIENGEEPPNLLSEEELSEAIEEEAVVEREEEEKNQPSLDSQHKKNKGVDANLVKTVEAALFLANRFLTFEEIAKAINSNRAVAKTLAETLRGEYEQKQSAIEIVVSEEGATMQAKPEFLQNVSELSKKPDLSRKATKILALVAKKGGLLQSELKKYFRGEIYEYTTELKQKGYVDWEKRGNTRYLKPSKKFQDTFQIA